MGLLARRPNSIEVSRALQGAIIDIMFEKTPLDYQLHGKVIAFLTGPLKEAFLERLNMIAESKAEYVDIDPADGILMRKRR